MDVNAMVYRTEATLKQAEGSTATGIVVPDEVLAALGAGKKPMTINLHPQIVGTCFYVN